MGKRWRFMGWFWDCVHLNARATNYCLISHFSSPPRSASSFPAPRSRCNLWWWLRRIFWDVWEKTEESQKPGQALNIHPHSRFNNDINNKLQSRVRIVGCNRNHILWNKRKGNLKLVPLTDVELWKEFFSVNLWVGCVVGGFEMELFWSAFKPGRCKTSDDVLIMRFSWFQCNRVCLDAPFGDDTSDLFWQWSETLCWKVSLRDATCDKLKCFESHEGWSDELKFCLWKKLLECRS